jgi:cysteine-rich repeat protein
MAQKSRLTKFVYTAIVAACMIDSLLAAPDTERAPAGQKCPRGSYVTGFDSEANIICSEACGNGVLNPGEACDDGNTESGDSCPATCQVEGAETEGADEEIAAQAILADTVISPTISNPIISDIKPSKLVFGKPELAITVSGTGFHTDTVIIFEGKTYTPRVNQAGTQLKVTIPTGDLSIGPYLIKVSNGPGMEAALKRALEIY